MSGKMEWNVEDMIVLGIPRAGHSWSESYGAAECHDDESYVEIQDEHQVDLDI